MQYVSCTFIKEYSEQNTQLRRRDQQSYRNQSFFKFPISSFETRTASNTLPPPSHLSPSSHSFPFPYFYFYFPSQLKLFIQQFSILFPMNQYEVNKLRKQLQRNQDVIQQLRGDLEFTQKKLAQVQAERDRYHSEIILMRESIQNVDGAISSKIQTIKLQQRKNFALKIQQHQKLKNDFDLEKNLRQKLMGDIQVKDGTISELTSKLREMARKHGDHTAVADPGQIKDNIAMNTAQYYKLTEKYNKLASDIENVIAENRILRKLHGVPDNFGFDLEEIKVAEKQELEDYKTQVKHLEAELEELQTERTQLRYRLRQYSSLYSNKGERYKDFSPEQFELLDAYALNLREGNVELPQIDKSKKEMEKKIIELQAQLNIYQGRFPKDQVVVAGGGNNVDVKKYHDEVKGLLSPVLDNIQKVLSKESNVVNYNTNVSNVRNNVNQNYRPPQPLPGVTNDWQNIEQGMSYNLNSKIPLELKQHYGETGFSIIKAKYDIGVLQLHNIENMKIIQEKEKVERELLKEIEYLKHQYKKFMGQQDDIAVKHFMLKEGMMSQLGVVKKEKEEVQAENDQFLKKIQVMEDSYRVLMNRSPSELEARVVEVTKRLAVAEGEALRTERKYKIISEEHNTLRNKHMNLEQKSLDIESSLRQKILIMKKNQDLLSETLSTILDDSKNSVSGETHNIIRTKLQIFQDKYASILIVQGDLRKRIASLEGADRSSHSKQKVIDTLRDDNADLTLELEMLKCRLSNTDPQYRSYEEIFGKFVKYITSNNISILTFFKKFDRSGDGLLQKEELKAGFSALGFAIEMEEFNLFFSFLDLDGSGSVNYKELLKKLRRAGVEVRSQEESGIIKLYQAITEKNFTLKRAFEAIDTDSSNMISKGEMEQALLRIGIPITPDTVEYIFRMVDNDMDGTINYNEFQQIFTQIVGQTEIQEKTIFNTTLDWKYAVMLKIDEAAAKNNITVIQAFELLDPDNSRTISVNELKVFFTKANIEISNNNLLNLFKFLDKDGSKSVRYDEFLDIIRDARKEKERIERIEYVKKREQEIRSEHSIANFQMDARLSQQATLRGKIMSLQLKQTHFTKKHQLLVKQLARRQADIKDLKSALELNQKSILKIQQDFYMQKEKNISLQQKSQGSLSVKQVDRLKSRYNHEHLQNAELKTQMELYKGLSNIFDAKTREYERNLKQVSDEKEKFYELVKDFQSGSDMNAIAGKLKIELEEIRYEFNSQQEQNERIGNQTKEIQAENHKLMKDVLEKEKEVVNTHLFFRQKSAIQQRTIDDLSGKILPTITVPKVEGLALKLRELSQGRSELEKQNNDLREQNHNIQLRNDYLEYQKYNTQELQSKLKRLYAGDQNAISIIELSKKLSQYKMIELKCKRESMLLKQKQNYYTRIHHTNQDIIKELQEELSKWEVKFTLSEESWRKKINDQIKLAEGLRLENAKQKEEEVNFFVKRGEEMEEKKMMETKLLNIDEGRLKKMNLSIVNKDLNLERRLVDVEKENTELRQKLHDILSLGKEIPHMQDYSVQGSQILQQSIKLQTDLTVSQLKNNANRFIKTAQHRQHFYQEQSSKLAQAAQQSITTLQGIIDDKNEQIRRKDKLIQDLKNDFLRTKEEDTHIIQELNEKLMRRKNEDDDGGNESQFRETTRAGRRPTETKYNDLLRILDEKDRKLRQYELNDHTMLKSSKYNHHSSQDQLKRLQNKIRDLQNQKQLDDKTFKQIQNDLKRKIKALEDLSKEKDKKLNKLQNSLKQIKSEILGEKELDLEMHENLRERVGESGGNGNNSQMETHLQSALVTIRNQKAQIEDLSSRMKAQEGIIVGLKEQMVPKGMGGTATKRPGSVRK